MISPFPRTLDKLVGGVQAAAVSLVEALAEHERVEKILVLTFDRDRTPHIAYLSDKAEVQYLRPVFMAGDGLLRSRQLVPAALEAAARFRPTVVHGQGLGREGRIACALGLPTVVTVHGLINVEARMAARSALGRVRATFAEQSVKAVLDRADVVISISDYDARSLSLGRPAARVSIPNAVPKAFFAAAGATPAPDTVLFAGVLRERKNVLGLVNAFAEVLTARPRARLRIAGPVVEPDYLGKVQTQVEALGIRASVEFLGHVSNDRLVQLIAESAVLTLFSFEETLPTIIAQALAVGRPVVASDVGGVREMVIDGESGWTVPSGDEAALAARLIETLADPQAAARMGRAGAVLARARFAAPAVAEMTVSAYDRAIDSVARATSPRSRAGQSSAPA